jgi:glycosyltransferase involved in cell wall biosynthesis
MAEAISISVVLPCYNEQGNIKRVAGEVLGFLKDKISDFEIIIVDDGSRDDTAAIAGSLSQKDCCINVVRHTSNLGYGAALKTGFRNASKDFIFLTDGDGQFDIRELPKLLGLIAKNDIVSGYRIRRRDSFVRGIYGLLWGKLINFLFGFNLKDINCAFKLYKKHVLKNMEIKSNGAFIHAEIYARAKMKGCRIAEVGVSHYPRKKGSQTGADLKVIFRAFKELWDFRRI